MNYKKMIFISSSLTLLGVFAFFQYRKNKKGGGDALIEEQVYDKEDRTIIID